jgi:hypothetical protein
VRTACDNELRDHNFQASLPREERSKGLQGICFPYVDLELKAEAAWGIKPDTMFTMSDGSHPKYLSRVGDKARAYFPHTTTLDMLSDPKVNVVITEGEDAMLWTAEPSTDTPSDVTEEDSRCVKQGSHGPFQGQGDRGHGRDKADGAVRKAEAVCTEGTDQEGWKSLQCLR